MASSFGSVFCSTYALATFESGGWSPWTLAPVAPISIHPGAHGLHYGSSCFEGLKAYRRDDGRVHIFRLDRHVERMQASAEALRLPVPDASQFHDMIYALVDRCRDEVPVYPGALYIRPILFGTLESVGAAGSASDEAQLVVLVCPVGDYFEGGMRPLRIATVTDRARAAPGFGCVKTGSNYAAALRPVLTAKRDHDADQVLFCPDGNVQETGAANFIVIHNKTVITKPLDDTILHGVTRDSLLTIAPSLGFNVEEREFSVDELLTWAPNAEAGLSGTAAVLAPVGVLIHEGKEHVVGDGSIGPNVRKLREALTAIQSGDAEDEYGWLLSVT